jgi:hypothetical protein
MVQLRHGGAFLLRRTSSERFPLLQSAPRGVGPAGTGAASRHVHGHGRTRRCAGGQMAAQAEMARPRARGLSFALALRALADQRGRGLIKSVVLLVRAVLGVG